MRSFADRLARLEALCPPGAGEDVTRYVGDAGRTLRAKLGKATNAMSDEKRAACHAAADARFGDAQELWAYFLAALGDGPALDHSWQPPGVSLLDVLASCFPAGYFDDKAAEVPQ